MRRTFSLAFLLTVLTTRQSTAQVPQVPWVNTSRSAITFGVERLPSGTPGTANNHRGFNGGQPSLWIESDGTTYLAGFSSGYSHQGSNAIAALRRSFDSGKTWGDEAYDTVIIDQNPLPDHRSLFSSYCEVQRGPYAGRLIAVGARGYVVNTEQYDSWSWWSDPTDRTTWHAVKMPQVSTYYTIGISCDQGPDGSVRASMYTRKLGHSGTRAYITYSADGGQSWQLYDNSIMEGGVNENALTGFPGVMYADAAYLTENKEAYAQFLRDHVTLEKTGTMLALFRSDDSIQICRKSYSNDGGRTWGTPIFAVPCYNYPAFDVSRYTGELALTTRHHTGRPPDGNDYSELFTSADDGATWSTGTPLYEQSYGPGSTLGDGPRWLGPNDLGVLLTWSPPGQLYNWCMLEYATFSRTTNQVEFHRNGVDYTEHSPTKYFDSNSIWGWWAIEWFRQNRMVSNTQITRWPNLTGDSTRDLVPSAYGGMLFADGSALVGSPDGLVGGVGIAIASIGNEGFQAASPSPIPQPATFFFVADIPPAGSLSSWLPVANDGHGASISYMTTNGGQLQSTIGGQTVRWAHTTAFPGGRVLITAMFNGADSRMHINGADLPKESGGTLPLNVPWLNFRPNGSGCCGVMRGLRESAVILSSDLVAIKKFEDELCVKHFGRKKNCAY